MLLEQIKNNFDIFGSCKVNEYIKYLESVKPDSKYLNKDFLLEYDSIITVGMSYQKDEVFSNKQASISKYSHGIDYHIILKDKLNEVTKYLKSGTFHSDVDSLYLDERICAYLSGFGYFGKNRFVINKKYGTFYFIGTILLKDSIQTETSYEKDSCNSCDRCVKECPTGCLEPYSQELCLSQVSQTKKYYDIETIKLLGNRIYGCDICQDVCPKNNNIVGSINKQYSQLGRDLIDIDKLFLMSQKEFKSLYRDSAMAYKGNLIIKRNAIAYILNNYEHKYLNYLENELTKYNDVKWYKDTLVVAIKYLKEKYNEN